ncbi:MAG: sulfite oxidase-like oxidoreductase [Halobacteriota archaeon]
MQDEKVVQSPDVQRSDRIPPGQRETVDWPVLHYGSVPKIETSAWTFTISGLVDKELTLNYEQFSSLPQEKVFSDIHCVTGWSKLNNCWEGVGTQTVKDLVSISPDARFVLIHAGKGFTTNLSLHDFFQPDVLFALKHDGELLTPAHGYPVRLIVPRLYFWKSAKWVTGVQFMSKDQRGFWESHGYHNRGDPWLEERYSD